MIEVIFMIEIVQIELTIWNKNKTHIDHLSLRSESKIKKLLYSIFLPRLSHFFHRFDNIEVSLSKLYKPTLTRQLIRRESGHYVFLQTAQYNTLNVIYKDETKAQPERTLDSIEMICSYVYPSGIAHKQPMTYILYIYKPNPRAMI